MTGKLARVLALGALFGAVGCSRKEPSAGLPPAKDWNANTAPATGPAPTSGAPDPHAGMDMSGGAGAMPHGDTTGQVAADPTHFVKGTVKVADAIKAKIPPGAAIFIYAKRPDAADPEGQRMPVASDKLDYAEGIAFELNESSAMAMPGALVGELVVSARFAQSGDVMSREVGDYIGSVTVTAPSENVVITIDTPVTPRAAPAMGGAMGGGAMGGGAMGGGAMGGGAQQPMPPGHP